MFTKLKQFKDMRDKAKTVQSALADKSAEGSAGWGKVKITMNGNQHVTRVMIDPAAMEQREQLQTYILEATNDAMGKIQKIMASTLQDMGGLDLANDMKDMMKK